MASAQLLKSGSYRVQVSKMIDGKLVKKSFTLSPLDCGGDTKLAKKKVELMANEWALSAEAEAHKTTVKKALEAYLDYGKETWSPSTFKDFVNMPKHFEKLYDLDVNEIEENHIQALIDEYSRKGLSPKTAKNRINFLIAALRKAKVRTIFEVKYYKAIKPELNPPEFTEFHRLLSMATPEEKLTIVLAGLYTLRRGEIGGLCGEDILWDMNSIYVHTSRVKNDNKEWVRRKIPKNLNSVRTIRIDPEIMALLPKVGPKDYVIKMNPDEITHHFIRLRKKACVNCRFHDLRKYAASIRSEVMPAKYIEAEGGWRKDSEVMRTIYDKPFKEKRKEYANKFNEQIIKDYGELLFGN